MTTAVTGNELADAVQRRFPETVEEASEGALRVAPDAIADVCRFLREDALQDFDLLNSLTAVDYVEYFELVYNLLSMRRNHRVVLKTQIYGRESPTAQSVIAVWQGADLQEREVWDLMGIHFDGHPNMKRIMLWEGFPGHPLRKDSLV